MCGKHISAIFCFLLLPKNEILLKFRFTLAGPIQLLANYESGLLEKKIRSLQKGKISLNIYK